MEEAGQVVENRLAMPSHSGDMQGLADGTVIGYEAVAFLKIVIGSVWNMNLGLILTPVAVGAKSD